MKTSKKELDRINRLKRKSRKYSIIDGAFATIKNSLGNSYIVPFAVAINASNSLIAMLSSIPGLLGPLSQTFSPRLMEKHSRKKIISKFVLIEILLWIPLILLTILFYKGIITSAIPFLLLIFFSAKVAIANIAGPAWFSLIGDLVDEKHRGRWFAKRTYIHGAIALIFTLLAAFFLDFFKKNKWTIIGFTILFTLAMIARFFSRVYLNKHYEPKLKLKKGYYFSFFEFIKKAPSNNFGKFAIFKALISFAAMIASPFFAVYLLRNLGFSYVTFMAVILSVTLFSILTIKLWGKFADKYGNYQVMKITSILISIFPLLWLISESPIFLILVPQLIAGVGWAGFNLAAGNFVFDSVTPEKRGVAVSYYNLLQGIGIFLGASIGAILVKVLTINFIDIILFIFLISAFARLTVSLIMLPLFKEIRHMKTFDSSKALKHLMPKHILTGVFEDFHELMFGKTHRRGRR